MRCSLNATLAVLGWCLAAAWGGPAFSGEPASTDSPRVEDRREAKLRVAVPGEENNYRRWKEEWDRRSTPEELQNLYDAALSVPEWQATPRGLKSQSSWLQRGTGIVDPDGIHHRSGRIRSMAFGWDPDLSDWTVFAGASNGGLWKLGKISFLKAWRRLSTSLPGSPAVGAFWRHPSNYNLILVGTGDRMRGSSEGSGMYRTTDGGVSWVRANLNPSPSCFEKIFADRQDPTHSTLYASGDNGIWRSYDAGVNWSRVYSGNITDLVQHPTDQSFFYFAEANIGIRYCFLDWTMCTTSSGIDQPIGRTSLAIAESVPHHMYAVVAGKNICENDPEIACVESANCPGATGPCIYNGGLLNGVYRSTNFGGTWHRIERPTVDTISGEQGFHANAIAVDPNDSDRLFVGMAVMQWTENATAADPDDVCWHRTWSPTVPSCSHDADSDPGHADITQFLFVPDHVDPGNTDVLITNDGGIYKFDYATHQVTSYYNTRFLNLAQIYNHAMTFAETDPDLIIAGTQDNGDIKLDRNGSPSVTFMGGGDGGPVSISPDDPTNFASSTGVAYSRVLSDDSGVNWYDIDCGLATLWAPSVRHHSYPGKYFLFTHDNEYLYYEYVFGAQHCPGWLKVNPANPLPAALNIKQLQVARSSDDVFYVTGWSAPGLYVLDSSITGPLGSMGWVDRTPNVSGGQIPNQGWAFADRSATWSNSVYYTTGDSHPPYAYWSVNRGQNWMNVTGDLADKIPGAYFWQLVANPGSINQLFMATSVGVFRSDNFGATWYRYMNGLPAAVDVTTIELLHDNVPEPLLVIGTYGNGFWERTLGPADHLFSDNFESGDTDAWSATTN